MEFMSTHRQYRNVIGESPIADSTYIYWVDAECCQIFRLNIFTQETVRYNVEIPVTAIAFTDVGSFILASKQGIYLTDATFQALVFICDPCKEEPDIRINDAVVSPNGDLWFGTMNDVVLDKPDGCIYILKGKAGDVIKFDSGFSVANGITFSPDGLKAYITNMFRGEIVEYILADDDVHFSSKRVFLTLDIDEGRPDGLSMDRQGNLYVCHWNGNRVSVYDPSGACIDRIILPATHVTRCTFYGPSLSQLVVTTGSYQCDETSLSEFPDSGYVFLLDTDQQGIADQHYKMSSFMYQMLKA
jgi:D-xylonolactonase|tara:strand:+ start:13995 stop:14897 length:903 start_codon:yes stop_codon:yes gene_type:complete